MNKKFFSSLLAVFMSVLFASGLAYGWGNTGGDGTNFGALQEKAVFINNTSGTLTSGQVVVFDRTGTGVTAGTTLGSYVTTTTSADSIEVAGVVSGQQQCPTGQACTIVTKGPAQALCQDGTDAVTTGSGVGTTTVAGRCGGGTKLGTALEAGAATDNVMLWIWVNPTNGD